MSRIGRNPQAQSHRRARGQSQHPRHLYRDWAQSRPGAVRVLALRFVPWKDWKLKSTSQRCLPISFEGDGTMTVQATDILGIAYRVFGVHPASVVPFKPWKVRMTVMPATTARGASIEVAL